MTFVKTLMETVSCVGGQERAADGASAALSRYGRTSLRSRRLKGKPIKPCRFFRRKRNAYDSMSGWF